MLVGIEFARSYGFTFAHYLRAAGSRYRVVSVLPFVTGEAPRSWGAPEARRDTQARRRGPAIPAAPRREFTPGPPTWRETARQERRRNHPGAPNTSGPGSRVEDVNRSKEKPGQ